MIRILLAIVLAFTIETAHALPPRWKGGSPTPTTVATLLANAPCDGTHGWLGASDTVTDSTAFGNGLPIAGGGSYTVNVTCQKNSVTNAYAWVVDTGYASATGPLNARALGFTPGGADNSPYVAGLAAAMAPANGVNSAGNDVNFSRDPSAPSGFTSYYFGPSGNGLEIFRQGRISCGNGGRQSGIVDVALVFGAGVPGVTLYNYLNDPAGVGGHTPSIDGCAIVSLGNGVTVSGGSPTAGSAITPMVSTSLPGIINNGTGTTIPPITFNVGDGFAAFPREIRWDFNATLTAGSATVVANSGFTPAGTITNDTAPPVGSMLTCSSSFLNGTFMLDNSGAPNYTVSKAQATTITQGCSFREQSGPPTFHFGSVIKTCSNLSGNLCVTGAGHTMTLGYNTSGSTLTDAPAARGTAYQWWLFPGPNAPTPQNYTYTNSLTGNFYPSFVGNVSGTALTASSGTGIANLNLGVEVIGGSNATASTTTNANMSLGQLTIPVTSCTGVNAGMYVSMNFGGTPVFPPGTTVSGCSGNTASLNITPGYILQTTTAQVTSGSTTAAIRGYYVPPFATYQNTPISGTNIPAGTTMSWSGDYTPGVPGYYNVTLSQAATGTNNNVAATIGGAMSAPTSGTAVSFYAGHAYITACPVSGCGTAGAYTLDTSFTAATGITLASFDTPATLYLTAGPRPAHMNQLFWTADYPEGALAWKVYGKTLPQTVIVGNTAATAKVNALQAHTSGQYLWAMPNGILRYTDGETFGLTLAGFPVNFNMACQSAASVPGGTCGMPLDMKNMMTGSMTNILVNGNNSGGGVDLGSQSVGASVAGITDYGTVGRTYISPGLQDSDNSWSTQNFIGVCGTQGTSILSGYLSGSLYSASCAPSNMAMLGVPAFPGTLQVSNPLWDQPYDAVAAQGAIYAESLLSGTSANSDLSGALALGGAGPTYTATYTFKRSYSIRPNCGVTYDQTTAANIGNYHVKSVTATTLTLEGSGTDTIGYICAGGF